MASFTLVQSAAAPAQTVFDVLTDHRGYAEITAARKVELEREGDPDPNGLGAIRAIHAVGPPIREQVVEFIPPTRFAYKLLSGLPVRNHVGTVTLEQIEGVTRVTYRIDTSPTIPVLGRAVVPVLRKVIADMLDGVVRESERRRPRG